MHCRRPAVALLLTAALVAASRDAPAVAAAAQASELDGTAWQLVELEGHTPETGPPTTLRFEKRKALGFDGCNPFTWRYRVQGAALEIELTGPSSMMTCAPERVHQAEAFVSALSGARRFRIEDGRLLLLDFADGVLAVLAPQPATLAGTAWRATAVNDGQQAVASVVKDSTVTLEFQAGGQAAGSAGCNRYTTRYVSDGASLKFGPTTATRMMCPRPELMAQEQSFLKALASVRSARAEGDRLELRTDAGAPAIVLERTAPAARR